MKNNNEVVVHDIQIEKQSGGERFNSANNSQVGELVPELAAHVVLASYLHP